MKLKPEARTVIKIYGLYDPRLGYDEVYVGASVLPESRFVNHLAGSRYGKTKKDKWICDLRKMGLQPLLVIYEAVSLEHAKEAEQDVINTIKAMGERRLLNAQIRSSYHSSNVTIQGRR